jgi:16S rRNA (uracil1498-N3)-methyltransferase
MPVYFIPSKEIEHRRIRLTGPLAHHLRDVLRCEVGDRFHLVDEAQRGYLAEVGRLDRRGVEITLIDKIPQPPFSPLSITLGQAVLKADKMEWVVQKGTELGIDRMVPLMTRRTTVRIRPERAGAQRERWNRIALEASQQSGRWTIPRIEAPQSLDEWLKTVPSEATRLILSEREEPGTGRKLFQNPLRDDRVVVLVGPEGGFEEEEVSRAAGFGFLPVSLGPRTLRAETASLAVLALVQYQWGDLG